MARVPPWGDEASHVDSVAAGLLRPPCQREGPPQTRSDRPALDHPRGSRQTADHDQQQEPVMESEVPQQRMPGRVQQRAPQRVQHLMVQQRQQPPRLLELQLLQGRALAAQDLHRH